MTIIRATTRRVRAVLGGMLSNALRRCAGDVGRGSGAPVGSSTLTEDELRAELATW